ncbi:MAG: rab guanine nucleotide exchange factor S2 [Caeruleum heppii]|nr:MAG: rab guanine nucleotide exchange factor S2 [Caeruleum heppii]
MALTSPSPSALSSGPGRPSDSELIGTIPDPRSRNASPSLSGADPDAPAPHPELSNEVATLSNKLISAINHQTSLDDMLGETRQSLEASDKRVRELEAVAQEHSVKIVTGQLLDRTEVEEDFATLRASLEEERKLRIQAERDKGGIELELETLTTALFEEANTMVAAARMERDTTERQAAQLSAKLKDSEVLLISHQDQLAELKSVMQQMGSDRDEADSYANPSTAPSTPGMMHPEHLGKTTEISHLTSHPPSVGQMTPSYPTSFSHPIHPVLRNDVPAYEDFVSLVRSTRKSHPGSRASSGSFSGLNVMGLGTLNHHTHSAPLGHSSANGSTSSISTSGTLTSSPATPSTPASALSTGSIKDASISVSLKDTRFYKRVIAEDIEPTLRLDTAPGLSWLARRAVMTSMHDGTLVVEPVPSTPTLNTYHCTFCNEGRKGEAYARRHFFRTSDSEGAQRYALCNYCLGRVRSTCDFLGFLRVVKDGHWRTTGIEGEKGAWEESVRLRERMFWARIGGGVVPAFGFKDSPRPSHDGGPPDVVSTGSESPPPLLHRAEVARSLSSSEAAAASSPSHPPKGCTDNDVSEGNNGTVRDTAETLIIAEKEKLQPPDLNAAGPAAGFEAIGFEHQQADGAGNRPEYTIAPGEGRLSLTIPGAFA